MLAADVACIPHTDGVVSIRLLVVQPTHVGVECQQWMTLTWHVHGHGWMG